VMLCIQPLFAPFTQLPLKVALTISSVHLMNFLMFVLLCRSYLWIFHVYLTSLLAVFPLIALNVSSDFAFLQGGQTLLLPVLVLLLTNRPVCMGTVLFANILTGLLKTKPILKEKFNVIDPDVFVNKLIHSNIAITIFILTLFTLILHNLNKKTKELIISNKVAEEAVEQQKTFIFSFSHEMRNPLNSLLGNLELILMGTVPSQVREMIKVAQTCGILLLQQINNVLDTGKKDLGKLEINLTQTKVYDLFQRVWTVSSELITRKNLQSRLKIEKKVPSLLNLDPHRINQVMMNLISNATKFTERGSITVSVKWLECKFVNERCFEPIPYDSESEGVFEKEEVIYQLNLGDITLNKRNRSSQREKKNIVLIQKNKDINEMMEDIESPKKEKRGVLKIVVVDTGCGMSQNSLDQLFEKFSQVSDDPTKRQIGSGLGLFITREICRKMNGDIRAYSKLGKGTTFIVCIPTVTAPTRTSDWYLSKSLPSMLDSISKQSFCCVVADDSPLNVVMICSFLNKLAVEIASTANNGYDAYVKYKESREAGKTIDIVTLDIDMPKMDGKTVCQKIREFEGERELTPAVIILISGNYDQEQVNDCLGREKRADYFLKKPLTFEEFSSAIYKLKYKEFTGKGG